MYIYIFILHIKNIKSFKNLKYQISIRNNDLFYIEKRNNSDNDNQ